MNQERGHKQKLGFAVEVDLLFPVEVGQIFFGDDGDGNIVDVDFFLFDEEKEEVEGAFKSLKPDLISIFGRGLLRLF
jgi:hypothetical protein